MDVPQATQTVATASVPQFNVGSVLSRSLSTLLKNPGLFVGLAIIATIPEIVLGLVAGDSPGTAFALSIITRICSLILTGAIVYAVYCILRGDNVTMGDAVKRGLSRFWPLVGASIIINFCTGIGFMLLLVPGLILMCMWAVAVPACVVEHLGPTQCLKRSSELTAGNRWTIFGLFFLVGLVMMVVMFAVMFVAALITGSEAVASILASLVAAVPAAFLSVMTATVYYDLRAVKEGVTVDKLANVFD